MHINPTGDLSVVPSMPQQRSDQHHPPGTPTMMHPATAAGPPLVAQSPAYSAQYFTCSPQQFASQPLVQQMTHYQSQVGFTVTLLFVFAHLKPLAARPAGPTLGWKACAAHAVAQLPSLQCLSPSAVQSSAVCLAKGCRQQLDRAPACGLFASLLISRAEFCLLYLKFRSQGWCQRGCSTGQRRNIGSTNGFGL